MIALVLAFGLVASTLAVPMENLARLDTLACGVHTMAPGERVVVQSPNFPQNYNVDYRYQIAVFQRCQWEIQCDPREQTYLEFICPSFELESSSACIYDRLVVTYQGSRQEKCGTDTPDGTMTTDGWTRLTFFSNANIVKPGFRCYIWCRAMPTTTTMAATTTAGAATTTAGAATTTAAAATTTPPAATTTPPAATTTPPAATTTVACP